MGIQVGGRADEQVGGCKEGWTDRQMDKLTYICTDWLMDQVTDE